MSDGTGGQVAVAQAQDEPTSNSSGAAGGPDRKCVPSRRGPLAVVASAIGAPTRWVRARWRRPLRVRTGLVVAVVTSALLAGGVWALQLRAVAGVADRDAAVAAAEQTTTALLSYDPQNVNGLVDRVGASLTETFRSDYATLISQAIAPATTQQQVSTEAAVVGSSVVLEASEGDRVVTLLFVNQTTRAGAEGAPKVAGSRVEVTMDDVDGRWLVSDVKPV